MIKELEKYNYLTSSYVIDLIDSIEYDWYDRIDNILLLKLGKSLLFNAVSNSWASQGLIKNLSIRKNKIHEKVVIGMLFGQFYMYDTEFYFNFTYLNDILEYLKKSVSAIDYIHWYEIFKTTINKSSSIKEKSLHEFIVYLEETPEPLIIDKNTLNKFKEFFKIPKKTEGSL